MERLLEELLGNSFAWVNFDDLTGITLDLPELTLSHKWRIHHRPFCMLAKSSHRGALCCARNKFLSNRRAMNQQEAFAGMCHLGLTDMVVPWRVRGRLLGVFYVGSVVKNDSDVEGKRRIEKYLKRRRGDRGLRQRLVAEYEKLPRASIRSLHAQKKKLELVLEVMTRFVETSGVLLERYPLQRRAQDARTRVEQSLMTQRAIHYIHQHYDSVIKLETVAQSIPCHPDTLCRTFHEEMNMGLPDYVQQVRVKHSKELLAQGRLSNGEISFRVGFQTQSHFNRVFKKYTGDTPSAYRKSNPPKII